jgi:hypothetical protein
MSSSSLYVAREALQFAFQLTEDGYGGCGEEPNAKRGNQKLAWLSGDTGLEPG